MNPKTHWVPKKNIPHMILRQIIFEHELHAPFNGAGTVSCNNGLSQYCERPSKISCSNTPI